MPYDLFLGIPVHRVPAVVAESGMTVDGWIPVDSLTLETSFPGLYAVGDVTRVGTPKAGVFAEGRMRSWPSASPRSSGGDAGDARYGGNGMCVAFLQGQKPIGTLVGPSPAFVENKAEFGRSRIARRFG